jgi:hypothetical protein
MAITNRYKSTNKVSNGKTKSKINSEEVHFLLKLMKYMLADYGNMILTYCESDAQTLHITLKSVSQESRCPDCGVAFDLWNKMLRQHLHQPSSFVRFWIPDRSARHIGLDDFVLKKGHV